MIKLHRAVDGLERNFTPGAISDVGEEPAGQCLVWLTDGTTFQPAESVEEVVKLLDAAAETREK
jgi:hypothetical protein